MVCLRFDDAFRPEKPYGLQGTGAGGGAGNESLGLLPCLHSSDLSFLVYFFLLFIFPLLLLVPYFSSFSSSSSSFYFYIFFLSKVTISDILINCK